MLRDPLDRFPGRKLLFGPSVADRLLANSTGLKLELLRINGDDEEPDQVLCDFELSGSLPRNGDPTDILLALIHQFRTPRGESEGAV
jgi:hypothetical protein